MLKLTKRTEYGLIALIHLVDRGDSFVSAREVGERYLLPKRLLAEVLKELQHAGLVESQLGASGGYRLTCGAERITLGHVIEALEGAPSLTNCDSHGPSLPGGECSVELDCPIRSPLQVIRTGIWHLLQTTTLRSLIDSPLDPLNLASTGR